jgi:hypothetical protein
MTTREPQAHESLVAQACREFVELGVATVYEASGRQGLIDAPLVPILTGRRVAGPALTVLCGQGDNLMVHAVMEHVFPSSVLVITMPEPEPGRTRWRTSGDSGSRPRSSGPFGRCRGPRSRGTACNGASGVDTLRSCAWRNQGEGR